MIRGLVPPDSETVDYLNKAGWGLIPPRSPVNNEYKKYKYLVITMFMNK